MQGLAGQIDMMYSEEVAERNLKMKLTITCLSNNCLSYKTTLIGALNNATHLLTMNVFGGYPKMKNRQKIKVSNESKISLALSCESSCF